MAESASSWHRVRNPVRNYWRKRESGWRGLGIKSPFTGGAFNRYDYRRFWIEQRGLCGVCDKPLVVHRWVSMGSGLGEVGTGQGIDLDHAHSHGYARSLTHGFCNRMVGVMDSKMALLVLNYLLKHEGNLEAQVVST